MKTKDGEAYRRGYKAGYQSGQVGGRLKVIGLTRKIAYRDEWIADLIRQLVDADREIALLLTRSGNAS